MLPKRGKTFTVAFFLYRYSIPTVIVNWNNKIMILPFTTKHK